MQPGGIRLGTSEVTRLGMKEGEMEEIAEFIKRLIINKEGLEELRRDVADFRKNYTKMHYSFESAADAYKYMKLG